MKELIWSIRFYTYGNVCVCEHVCVRERERERERERQAKKFIVAV